MTLVAVSVTLKLTGGCLSVHPMMGGSIFVVPFQLYFYSMYSSADTAATAPASMCPLADTAPLLR